MLRCTVAIERWKLKTPFRIHGASMAQVPLIVVTLRDGQGHVGRGEAAGVDYLGETPETMQAQILALPESALAALTLPSLQWLLPPGGARNALDCALRDLQAKQSGLAAARHFGLPAPLRPLTSALTIGLGDENETREKLREAFAAPLLKLKFDADRHLDVVNMARELCPRARLIADANGAFTPESLQKILPQLAALGVELLEQPLPVQEEEALSALSSPIPLAADESCQTLTDLPRLRGRYQFINIKLDKCGGLTAARALIDAARAQGFELMVGNMCGSSLAMAPAFLVGQYCRYVDLDGPQLQCTDRQPAMRYENQLLYPPEPALWG